jgi:hypothetical protein
VALGLLALILLAVAAMSVQAKRGGVSHRHMLEASNLAQDLLEVQLARSVYDMPVGVLASIAGQLQDQTAYQADVESYSLVGAGPAYVGLTDQDIKRVRVSVRWRDLTGVRLTQAESVLARLAK